MLKERITDSKVNKYKGQIVSVLEAIFQEKGVKAYLYGSRSRGEANQGLDIYLAIQSKHSISSELSKTKESFFESTIPYKVDVVDLNRIDKNFRKDILKDKVLIWKNQMKDRYYLEISL